MKLAFLIILFVIPAKLFSQATKDPVDVTPQIQKKIKQDIEKEISQVKLKLESEKLNPAQAEFTLDTFRVARFMEKWIGLDFRDYGMSEAGYAAAELYDSLLNKYYKRLLSTLKGDDKKILVQAQKSWLAFRDSEYKLVETISKDEYFGGGTMQRLTESSEYLNLIKERTITIFEHYIRATQNY